MSPQATKSLSPEPEALGGTMMTSKLPDLTPTRVGKVRELYDLGDAVLIVATDRISAFDVVMENGIPDKGRVLNQMSAFWFEKLADTCPSHVISVDDGVIAGRLGERRPELAGRSTLAKKAIPLPVECVARGYLAGSLWKEYRTEGSQVHGINFPTGLLDSSPLPEPIFSPATKAEEGHDENISFSQVCDLIGRESAERVRDWTLTLYRQAAEHARSAGLILADTKFEFGETPDGLVWIDEALTPDSSRYWNAHFYAPGHSQPSFDKQFLRDYLEASGWEKRSPGPRLPKDVVAGTRERYLEAFQRITGRTLSA